MRRTISRGCSGVGWQTTFTPAISGSSDAHRQAEAMKDGQGIEQDIAVVKIDMGAHLGDIGQQIVRWLSATPLGSPSVPEVNRIAAGLSCDGLCRHQRGREAAGQRRQLVGQRQLGAHVFEIDELATWPTSAAIDVFQLAELDEAVGGDDALHLRGAERAFAGPQRRR